MGKEFFDNCRTRQGVGKRIVKIEYLEIPYLNSNICTIEEWHYKMCFVHKSSISGNGRTVYIDRVNLFLLFFSPVAILSLYK